MFGDVGMNSELSAEQQSVIERVSYKDVAC